MEKRRSIAMIKPMSLGNINYIEKYFGCKFSDTFKEFISHYSNMSLYESMYNDNDVKWEVTRIEIEHWIIVVSSAYMDKGYGKKVFFALNPEGNYYCLSYDKESYGKIILVENIKAKIWNEVTVSYEMINLPKDSLKERIVADSFENFINGLEFKPSEEIIDVLYYCEAGKRKGFDFIQSLNIRPRMTESDFIELEKMYDVELPVFFKEFMKRYSDVRLCDNLLNYYDGKKREISEFYSLFSIKRGNEWIEEISGFNYYLPFASSDLGRLCISFDEENYGQIVNYDDFKSETTDVNITVVSDDFEEFVNNLKYNEEYDSYDDYCKLYYCNENLLF